MWDNAFKYNPPETDAHRMASELKRIFEDKYRDLDKGGGGSGGGDAEMKKMRKQMAEMQKQMQMQQQLMQQQQAMQLQQQQMQMSAPAAPSGGSRGRSRAKQQTSAFPLVPAAESTALVPVDETRDMTYEEKADVSARINKLNSQNLSKVVQIIKESMPMLGGEQGGEIDVDINALDTRTLWKLHTFVKSCEAAKRKARTCPARIGPHVPWHLAH